MGSRSFKVFETKKYLESIFNEFRKNNVIKYYKCGKSDSNKVADITKINNFSFLYSNIILLLFAFISFH